MKKKTRRIKRSVRKTVGALFLASSVIVAAIPTSSYQGGNTEAATFTDAPDFDLRYELGQASGLPSSDPRKSAVDTLLTSASTSVPYIKPVSSSGNANDITDVTVYTSEDSLYQFAYVSEEGRQSEDGNMKYAFILKYNTPGSLPGGNLTIPNTVDAYLAYNTNDGSSTSANVAVGKSGNYLFYRVEKTVTDYDVSGNVSGSHTEYAYYPCYASTRSEWAGISEEDLYWFNTSDFRPAAGVSLDFSETAPADIVQVGTDQSHQRISNAPVRYIANQYIEIDSSGNYHIKKITDSSQGIFYGNGNIVNLTTGTNLNGIGDYAFYNCTGLNSFTFSDGLKAIGNHSFEYCSSLTSITLPYDTNLSVIGAYAFKNCTTLESFTVPKSVKLLCDGVFQNCKHMTECRIYGESVANSSLRYLGNGVFYGCSDLVEIEFPEMYTESDVNISNFLECYSLERLITHNTDMDFIDDSEEASGAGDGVTLTFDEWLKDLSPNFYIAGIEIGSQVEESPMNKWGKVHLTCRDEQIAYNYYPTTYFEKTITEKGGGTVRYLVDGNNNLKSATVDGTVYTLTMPEYIGPNYIKSIGRQAFANICTLTMVTIPSTLESIGDEAFRGCHNLQYVYFENDTVQIGTDAFKTQDLSGAHSSDCTTGTVTISGRTFQLYSASDMTVSNKPAVQLYFVGTIDADATPYQYAMSYLGRFNNASQSPSFAKFLSGYPSCQEIEFVLDDPTGQTGKATLVDFPVLSDTSALASYTNPDTSYLTTAQKDAIASAQQDYNNGIATEDQIAFVNATHNLVIPLGVDAIKNGLFFRKTASSSDAMGVTLYGINDIEAVKDPTCSSDDITNESCPPDVKVEKVTVTYTPYGGTTPVTVNNVPNADFAECPNLTSLTLMGSDTKNLQDFAFYGCTGLATLEAYCPISTIGDHCFSGDTNLNTVDLNGDINTIERHAFEDCSNLTSVSVDDSISTLGVAPFRGCDKLADVDFNGSPNFVCDDSIIYSTDSNGTKLALLECLPARSAKYVNATETAGINAISSEAFAECNDIKEVDLTGTNITTIPSHCFEEMDSLRNVKLPFSTTTIKDYAFEDSTLEYLEATQALNLVGTSAFDHMKSTGWDPSTQTGDHTNNSNVTICAPEGSYMQSYADLNGYTYTAAPKTEYFDVKFYHAADDAAFGTTIKYTQIGDVQVIMGGEDAVPPTPYVKDGWKFTGWDPSYEDISGDTVCFAQYEERDPNEDKYRVRFYYDSEFTDLYDTVYVAAGENAADLVRVPYRAGYDFIGWQGKTTPTDSDQDVFAGWSPQGDGYWTVTYYTYDGSTIVYTAKVKDGEDAPVYAGPVRDGYTFTGWSGVLTGITQNTVTLAQYTANSGNNTDSDKWTVTYYSYDASTVLFTMKVANGEAAPSLMAPEREGYTFTGWSGDLTSITADTVTIAQYKEGSSSDNKETDTKATYYTLTVVGGSGSGSYIAGSNVIILADDPGTGKEFGSWSVSPASTPIASKVLSSTVVTMPAENVTVTANFVASTSGRGNNGTNGGGSGTGGNNGNTNYWPSTGNVPRSSGTTVVIEKNGLSNTGVVSATVNGSTDNFTIKITQSQTADKQVLDALLKKYGSLDNIVYFPMDISLYDAAGTTQIHDTSGLTITITLPLPDSMIQYAANNKVAVITNGEIDGLNANFTTINGVPCVTFTCTHFSPYVIYVNTVEMTAGSDGSGSGNGGLDNTPKTADFIHPKWFISIALFAISIALFAMRDKKVAKPVKADNANNRPVRKQ